MVSPEQIWLPALLEGVVDGILSIDERGIIQFVNHAVERIFGYSAAELLGQNVSLLMPSPHREDHDQHLARYLATGIKHIIGIGREVVGRRKDGTSVPLDLAVTEAWQGKSRVFVGVLRDLTERQRDEERFRLAVEAAPSAMVMVDAAGRITLVNRQTELLFGYQREELLGHEVEILIPERLRGRHPSYRATFNASPQARPMGVGRDLFARRKDGSEFPVEIGLTPIETPEGLLVLSAIVDITERKRAEEALRLSEGQLREQARVLEHAQVLVHDLENRIVYWSQGASRLFGWTAAEAIGQVATELLRTTFPQSLQQTLQEVQQRGEWDGELRRYRKDGALVVVASHWVLYHNGNGQPRTIVEVCTDITDRKRAEEEVQATNQSLERALTELQAKNDEVKAMTQQLWQAAKLASVGELAASIAHELNNPLATVSLRVESVLARTPADDPRRHALGIIAQETKRMGDLVANLLQFSRRSGDQASTVDVREELVKAVELVHHYLRKRLITVVEELAPETPSLYADRQKLRQVFLNLLTNAADAMPEGGTLTLRTQPIALTPGKPAVQVDVTDTGIGIPAENLPRVLDPFFTTKEEGHGTGLGLAICRRIVQEHHGTIQLLSKVGEGTTVRLVLPVKNGVNVTSLRRPDSEKGS